MKSLVALVGMKHRGTEALVASLPQGEPLILVREPGNKFDRFAVQVWARGQHVAYLKATQVRPIAIAMDARPPLPVAVENGIDPAVLVVVKSLSATLAIDGGKWPMVDVDLTPKKEVPRDVG